ncbi:MAG: hypothetical protein ACLFN8_02860 [Candidatus Woesearchaeota archaeon]
MRKLRQKKEEKEEKMKKNLKAQAWSIDIIVGVIIFLVVLVVVYTLVATSPLGNIELRRDADSVHSKFDRTRNTDPEIPSIFSGNVLIEEEITKLLAEEYEELKTKLGIKGDFCIVITYMNEGIYNMSDTKTSYGNSADNILIGKDKDGNPIYCGE